MSLRGFRVFGASTLVALLVAGCGIQDKKENAERIRNSVKRLAAQKTAAAQFAFSVSIVDVPSRGAAGAGILGLQQVRPGARTPELSALILIDYQRKLVQASLPAAAPGQEPVPYQVFAGDRLYQRRLSRGGAEPTGGRQWVKLDFGEQYEDRKNKRGQGFGSQSLNPAWLVQLVGGALMGSVEEVGAETIRDVPTLRYKVNFSWDDAFDDADDEERKGFLAAATMMGIPEKVVKGEIWLDRDGMPRRIKANVRQQRNRNEELELHYLIELFDFGTGKTIVVPSRDAVSEVDDLGAIVQAINPLGDLG